MNLTPYRMIPFSFPDSQRRQDIFGNVFSEVWKDRASPSVADNAQPPKPGTKRKELEETPEKGSDYLERINQPDYQIPADQLPPLPRVDINMMSLYKTHFICWKS